MWKRIGLGLLVLFGLALVANGFMAWWTEHRLQNRIAAIRATGDPASIADLAPTPVPENENAAALLARIAPRLTAFSKEYGPFWDTLLGKDYDKRIDRGEPATTEQMVAIRAIMKKYADVDAGLAAAAACEKYASLVDFSADHVKFSKQMIDHQTNDIRTAARFLDWQMQVLLADKQYDQAAARGIEMLRLARLYDHEPTMLNMLVACAIRGMATTSLYDALAAGPVSPQIHAALEKELDLQKDSQRMLRMLKSERAYAIDATFQLPIAMAEAGLQSPPPSWVLRMLGWPMKRYFVGVLDYYDREIRSADQPWIEFRKRVEHQENVQTPSGYGVLADSLRSSVEATYEANTRMTAFLRSLRIFDALTQYRDKHGHEASGLADLSLPKEETIDPFDGKPLKLKQTKDGWMIYTVMRDGVDDGGNFDQLKDYGLAPPRERVVYHEEEDSSGANSRASQ
jgi:hypothetical protein